MSCGPGVVIFFVKGEVGSENARGLAGWPTAVFVSG